MSTDPRAGAKRKYDQMMQGRSPEEQAKLQQLLNQIGPSLEGAALEQALDQIDKQSRAEDISEITDKDQLWQAYKISRGY